MFTSREFLDINLSDRHAIKRRENHEQSAFI